MYPTGFENCYGLVISRGHLFAPSLNWGTYYSYSILYHHCKLGMWVMDTLSPSLKVSLD